MTPNGAVIGSGRYPYWRGKIRPFFDSDVQIPVIFYPAAKGAKGGLVTVFTDRFWDDRENWAPDGVGTVPKSLKVAPGITVTPGPGNPIGKPEWFTQGLSYSTWVAGGYGPGAPMCTPVNVLSFFGFSSYLESTVSLPSGTATASVPWAVAPQSGDVTTYDYGGFLTPTDHTTLTIPAGAGGIYRLTVELSLVPAGAGVAASVFAKQPSVGGGSADQWLPTASQRHTIIHIQSMLLTGGAAVQVGVTTTSPSGVTVQTGTVRLERLAPTP